MTSGATSPTAPVMNSALPVQVSERIPPSSTDAATTAATAITATREGKRQEQGGDHRRDLQLGGEQQGRGWKLQHARGHAEVARAEAVTEKARQGVRARLAQIGHEQHGREQKARRPAEPDGERIEAEKENRSGIGEESDSADRGRREREPVEHGRNAPPRGKEVLDIERMRADGDDEIEDKRNGDHGLGDQGLVPAELLQHGEHDDERDQGARHDAVIGAKMRVWRAQTRMTAHFQLGSSLSLLASVDVLLHAGEPEACRDEEDKDALREQIKAQGEMQEPILVEKGRSGDGERDGEQDRRYDCDREDQRGQLMAITRGIVRNGNVRRHFVPLSLIETAKR